MNASDPAADRRRQYLEHVMGSGLWDALSMGERSGLLGFLAVADADLNVTCGTYRVGRGCGLIGTVIIRVRNSLVDKGYLVPLHPEGYRLTIPTSLQPLPREAEVHRV